MNKLIIAKLILGLILIFVLVITANSQSLTLNQLNTLCRKDITNINSFLLNKNWKYSDHAVNDSDETISWIYFQKINDEQPEAFFTVHMKKNDVNGIDYQFKSKSIYKNFVSNISDSRLRKDSTYFKNGQMRTVYLGKDFFYTIINLPNSPIMCPYAIMVFKNTSK